MNLGGWSAETTTISSSPQAELDRWCQLCDCIQVRFSLKIIILHASVLIYSTHVNIFRITFLKIYLHYWLHYITMHRSKYYIRIYLNGNSWRVPKFLCPSDHPKIYEKWPSQILCMVAPIWSPILLRSVNCFRTTRNAFRFRITTLLIDGLIILLYCSLRCSIISE